MSEQINHRALPQNVRMGIDEAFDFGLEKDYVYICDKCHVFLLTEERALNHKKCKNKWSPISKNVTVPKKRILLQSIQQQLSIIENNKNDIATKKYEVFPSTSNQSYTPVCADGQCVEVVDDSYCGPDDATSVIGLNKQQMSILSNDDIANQPTACEKITIGKQSKLIKTSTPQEALLEVPTTSTFTNEVRDSPTFQCLSCCSMMESLKNEINILKIKYAELEKKIKIGTTDRMETLKNERDYYENLCSIMLKEHLDAVNNHQSSERKLSKLKEEILCSLKSHCMEL